jgi:recombination protein RecA
VSREGEIIELGVGQGLIEKSGAWYSYNGDRIGQGRENVRKFLKENPDISRHLEKQIRAALIPDAAEESTPEDVPAEEGGKG